MNIKDSIDNADWTQIVETTEGGKQGSKTFSEVWKQIVPVGTIVMWYGEKYDIPDDWTICDGTKGTPNLLNKFIVAGNTFINEISSEQTPTIYNRDWQKVGNGNKYMVWTGTNGGKDESPGHRHEVPLGSLRLSIQCASLIFIMKMST